MPSPEITQSKDQAEQLMPMENPEMLRQRIAHLDSVLEDVPSKVGDSGSFRNCMIARIDGGFTVHWDGLNSYERICFFLDRTGKIIDKKGVRYPERLVKGVRKGEEIAVPPDGTVDQVLRGFQPMTVRPRVQQILKEIER